eukprot:1620280-Pyramimonas_sp.AAC.1
MHPLRLASSRYLAHSSFESSAVSDLDKCETCEIRTAHWASVEHGARCGARTGRQTVTDIRQGQ